MWTIDTVKQVRSVLDSNARINIWHGSVRSGKTVLSLIRWIMYITNFQNASGAFVMVGKTERTLYRNILYPLIEVFQSQVNVARGSAEAVIFGVRVLLVGANDERAEQKIRGGTFAGAYCDEITLYPESFFRMLLSRLSVKDAKLFGTTNPDNPSHWLYKDFITNDELVNKKVFHYRIDDNPHLTDEYKDALKNEYTGLWYRRFYLGEWVSGHGAIYDMFDRHTHIFTNTAQIGRNLRFVAVDYGIQNPCVFLLFNKHGDTYHVLKEYYWNGRETGRQKTDNEYVDDLKKWLAGEPISYIIVDPSATSFIVSLKKAGFQVKLAKNSVMEGIQFVAKCFTENKLFINEKCENTKRELESYVWDEKASNRGIEQPVKFNDHCVDTVRYGVYTTEKTSDKPKKAMPIMTRLNQNGMRGMI